MSVGAASCCEHPPRPESAAEPLKSTASGHHFNSDAAQLFNRRSFQLGKPVKRQKHERKKGRSVFGRTERESKESKILKTRLEVYVQENIGPFKDLGILDETLHIHSTGLWMTPRGRDVGHLQILFPLISSPGPDVTRFFFWKHWTRWRISFVFSKLFSINDGLCIWHVQAAYNIVLECNLTYVNVELDFSWCQCSKIDMTISDPFAPKLFVSAQDSLGHKSNRRWCWAAQLSYRPWNPRIVGRVL